MKKPWPDTRDGDVFSLADWDEMVAEGVVTPDDGSGYYANGEGYDPDRSVWGSIRPEWTTHVVWYNK